MKTLKFITRTFFLLPLFMWMMQPVATAQVITSNPLFPTDSEPIEIIFDATEGNGELAGFTGDVFLWTGLITNSSTTSSDWKFVQANDFNTDFPARLQAEPLGDDLWRFVIGPSVREFYGVTSSSVVIEQVAMLFRGVENGTVTKVGRDTGGSDIFLEIFEPGNVNVQFNQPSVDQVFLAINEQLAISATGDVDTDDILTLSLTVDGSVVASVQNNTINFDFSSSTAGVFEIIVTAEDESGGSDADTLSSVVNPDPILEARPAGLQDGITHVGDTGAILSLFAPGKDFIYLIGDFNDWQVSTDFFMKRDVVNDDNVWYWIEIDGLTPGSEYGFQYLVDGEIRVADPYSELVLDPNDDQFITDATFPNLKPYPEDKTRYQVGVLQPGKAEFPWQVDEWQRPAKEELVIYELLVRDFTDNHDFATLTDTLGYLENLGVNAIELMPIMHFEGNSSWGFNPAFHLAVDKYYGPADELKRFIDEAHSRDMVVILDMVLNHAFNQSPLVRLWNEGTFGRPTADNPYFNVEPTHPFNVGSDFNHESEATKQFVDRVNRHWLEEFRFDGFRFDLSKGFTQFDSDDDVGLWGQRDDSRIALLTRMAEKIWEVDPEAYVILEHFAEDEEERILSDRGMLLWNNQNRNYNEATMGFNTGDNSNFSSVHHSVRGFNQPGLVSYMESHDEQWMMLKNRKFGNRTSDLSYDVKELSTALERQKIAGAFFFTVPGPKMMWQFGELGYGGGPGECLKPGGGGDGDCLASDPGRTAEKPIRWDYFEDPERRDLFMAWRALINLRKSHPAFTSGDTEFSGVFSGANKSMTLIHPDLEVHIAGNFDIVEETRQLNLPSEGTWYEFFSGTSMETGPGETPEIILRPGEFRLFTTQFFETPEEGIFTSNETPERTGDGIPESFRLLDNFPNPFNPSTQITYEVPEVGSLRIEVFNMIGQRVATLVDEQQHQTGSFTITFDATNLSSGVYIARMVTGSRTMIQKMTLIK